MAAYKDAKTEGKARALKGLESLMDNVSKRSLPGGKVTPGKVDAVQVSRKPTQGSKNFKATGKSGGVTKTHSATPQHKEYPAPKPPVEEEDPLHEASEDSKLEAEEHAEGDVEKEFMDDRAQPTDTMDMNDAAQVDKALKSFMVKPKKWRGKV